MVKLLQGIKEYSLRDLIPYAVSQLFDRINRSYSTLLFYIRCYWHGVDVDSNARVWGNFKVRRFPGSTIKIGQNLLAVCRPGRYAFNIFPQAVLRTYLSSSRIIIGDNVGFNSIAIFCRSQTISIGDGTLIGGNCQITDSDGHPLWPPEARSTYAGDEFDASVTIGKNVFIGLNVIILKGTEIGDNSIIGAGSVVKGKIPANCMASGVPAKVQRVFE